MIRNLDISLLRAFTIVARTENMTAASSQLGLTQGAVSQRIKRLEDMLQCQLFDRTQRQLKLTKSGIYLLGRAKELLELNDEIWNEVSAPELAGKVRLGLPYDLVSTYLPLAVKNFSALYPLIDVSLHCESSPDLYKMVNNNEIDLALIEEPVARQKTKKNMECLYVERLVWVGCQNGMAHKRQPLPVSIVGETCAFHPVVCEKLTQADIYWSTAFENNNFDATLAVVRADLAVTVLLESLVPDDLIALGPNCDLPELPPFAINLYQNRITTNSATSELAQHLRGTGLTLG